MCVKKEKRLFWLLILPQDDAQELDIEAVTPGTSIVNGTINYTTQPSTKADWSPIPNATLSLPLQETMNEFRTHRFDCDPVEGIKYYMNDKLMHTDNHNLPKAGGSLQLKLWADGNKWWSGIPSKTDVHMRVKSIIAYYNTTSSLGNLEWDKRCKREQTQCIAVTSTKFLSPSDSADKQPTVNLNATSTRTSSTAGTGHPISEGSRLTSVACPGLQIGILAMSLLLFAL